MGLPCIDNEVRMESQTWSRDSLIIAEVGRYARESIEERWKLQALMRQRRMPIHDMIDLGPPCRCLGQESGRVRRIVAREVTSAGNDARRCCPCYKKSLIRAQRF